MFARVWRGLGEKGKGTEKYRLVVTKQSRDVKYGTGNTVSLIVITMCGAKGILEVSQGTPCKVCRMPQTNIK